MANTNRFIQLLSVRSKDYDISVDAPTNNNDPLLATLTHETTSIHVLRLSNDSVFLDVQPFTNNESLYKILRLIHVSLASLAINSTSVYVPISYTNTNYYGVMNDHVVDIQNPITLNNNKALRLVSESPCLIAQC